MIIARLDSRSKPDVWQNYFELCSFLLVGLIEISWSYFYLPIRLWESGSGNGKSYQLYFPYYNPQQAMQSYQLLDSFKQNCSIHKEIEARNHQGILLFFGIYKIGKIIGHGAFADVYEAQHTGNGRTFALKVINCEEILARYESKDTKLKLKASIASEQSNMRKCHSAHIIKVYESFENSKSKVYVLQYCNQGNLQNYLKKRGALKEKDAIVILKQIIFGLAEMHRNGIIHRDLKPANILIHNGIFKIADLGFSKELQRVEEVSKHTCLGTKSTMAPEVFNEQPYGLKADIWSIGMIFFLMIHYDTDLNLNQNFKVIERYIHNKDKFKSRLLYENSISLEVRDFLKRTLEVDQDKRLNWQEILSHPIFARNQEDLSQFFVPSVHEQFQKLKKKKQASESTKSNNPEEFQEFEILNKHYFQCRKAEYIFKNLIVPLEQLKIIDLNNHQHLELLLLLTNRCKANINHAEQEIYLRYSYKISESFRQQIETLRQRIEIKYEYISDLLRNYENKISTMIKDRVRKIADKTGFKQKCKFLNGVEGLDYNKNQQIQFTQLKYVSTVGEKLQAKQKEERQVKDILKVYGKVAFLRLEDLNGASLAERVKQLIEYN